MEKPTSAKSRSFELRHNFVQVLGESIVVVAVVGWLDLAESSAVVDDNAISCIQKSRHLLFPRGALSGYPWIKTLVYPTR